MSRGNIIRRKTFGYKMKMWFRHLTIKDVKKVLGIVNEFVISFLFLYFIFIFSSFFH